MEPMHMCMPHPRPLLGGRSLVLPSQCAIRVCLFEGQIFASVWLMAKLDGMANKTEYIFYMLDGLIVSNIINEFEVYFVVD
jgi:hypothetical protein